MARSKKKRVPLVDWKFKRQSNGKEYSFEEDLEVVSLEECLANLDKKGFKDYMNSDETLSFEGHPQVEQLHRLCRQFIREQYEQYSQKGIQEGKWKLNVRPLMSADNDEGLYLAVYVDKDGKLSCKFGMVFARVDRWKRQGGAAAAAVLDLAEMDDFVPKHYVDGIAALDLPGIQCHEEHIDNH